MRGHVVGAIRAGRRLLGVHDVYAWSIFIHTMYIESAYYLYNDRAC